jgi:aspartate 1-decarboxylase
MNRLVLRSKIHRATVTEANLDYEGSVTVDSSLLEAADIAEYEQVHIYDVTSGSRVITYAMLGPPGSGVVCINGAAAHLVHPGDIVIIAAYGIASPEDLRTLKPRIIQVDEKNRQV